MPPINQMRSPDMSNWQQLPAQQVGTQAGMPTNPDVTTQTVPQRSPLMRASMPLAASTADAYVRQFYGVPNAPSYRILPAKGATAK